MFYQQQAGLPRPQVSVPIFDFEERLIGIADLFDDEAGFVTEFDGQAHRLRRKHHADNVREEKLEGTNLTVCRVGSLDMRQAVPWPRGSGPVELRVFVVTAVTTAGPSSSRPGGSSGGPPEFCCRCCVSGGH